jgi:Glutamate-1-semialdehyde aminotransferase
MSAHHDLVGPKSRELRERAARSLPGGVDSNIRLASLPLVFTRGEGARVWDADGREYVDYVLGQGPNFLGHAQPEIAAAVAAACADGMLFGGTHPVEIEAAERTLAALGWAERIRLGSTGTESVQAALRLARAVTGRERFVRFRGHYHGWLDNVLLPLDDDGEPLPSRGRLASHVDDSFLLEWNDAGALEQLVAARGDEIAAVIMEPMMANTGAMEPREGYLERVRELCSRSGIVLIFDEVITGFRLARGGAVEHYGVVPDLAVYGKAIAGGWPVAALAGRADLMDEFATGGVNHSGTYNGSVMAGAAVAATQRVLDAAPPYAHIAEFSSALQDGIRDLAASAGVALRVRGLPSAFHVGLGPDVDIRDYRELLQLDLAGYSAISDAGARAGLWTMRRGMWFVSAAHGEAELADTLHRFETALSGR